MAYQVLSLKWRPKTFEDVVGQVHVTDTLVNAFKKERIAQAYLFTGPRGVGKTTTARILAAALNCKNDQSGKPCNQCSNCLEIADSRNMDVLEIDGASNRGIEEIRNLREMIKYAPINSPYKIFIIDEVHMLTGPAFNALLKTLEEPPEHGKFILATTDIHKVPLTIISRCQRYDFNRITVKTISARLIEVLKDEDIAYEIDSIQALARKADGSMRDGLSYLDQVIAYCGDKITYDATIKILGIIPFDLHFDLSSAIHSGNAVDALKLLDNIQSSGTPVVDFVNGFSQHIRNLLYASLPEGKQVLGLSDELNQRYEDDAPRWDRRDLLRIANLLLELETMLRHANHPYLLLEVLFLKLLEMDASVSLDEVLKQLPVSYPGKLSTKIAEPAGPKPASSSHLTAQLPIVPKEQQAVEKPLQQVTVQHNDDQEVPTLLSQPVRQPEKARFTIETIQGEWSAILSEINQNSISVGNILEQSRIIKIENNLITIGVNGQPRFNMDRVDKKKDQIESIISRHIKTAVRIKFVKIDSAELPDSLPQVNSKEPEAPPGNREGIDNREAVVDRIIELFDGEQIR
ncbi:MAG: DNA polymerase III subunit gamma/tau [Candidatus Marinimicrobia bacterium]|nr:DNA polymerase III subunit gamma/tau [Candidatus Neomarinimicrobiota bacterium]